MTSRRAHFLWSHIVCFSYETPAGRFNFEFLQTYSNYMTSIWLVCLISRAPLAGATLKYPHSNELGVLIPHAHCIGSAIIAFSVVQTRRATSTNTSKIWYLHWNTELLQKKNNESSTEMTINYRHVYAYTILNHIQYRYTTRTPHERHGIPNTGNLTFF